MKGPRLVSTATMRTRTWPADVGRLREIRGQTRAWLSGLRLSAADVADVVLAVNEAVSNAVEHAYREVTRGTVELTVSVDAHALCIDVVDHGRWRTPGARDGACGGHGLSIMRSVTESVAIHQDRSGTRVRLRRSLAPG